MEKKQEIKPSIEKCIKAIIDIDEDNKLSEEDIKHKANWLYILNRISFWDDLPILIEIIKYEIKLNQSN